LGTRAQPKWPKWGRQHQHEQPETGKKKVEEKKGAHRRPPIASRAVPVPTVGAVDDGDGQKSDRTKGAWALCATCPPVRLRPRLERKGKTGKAWPCRAVSCRAAAADAKWQGQ